MGEPFDAQSWVRQHVLGATDLRPETWAVVSNFTVLWNLFEAQKCGTDAKIGKIEARVNDLGAGFALPTELIEARAYWADRYTSGDAAAQRYSSLNVEKHRSRLVLSVLSNPDASPKDTLTALLLIIRRLRNNLFHGIKEIPNLNEQFQNLDHGCRVLAVAIEILPSVA